MISMLAHSFFAALDLLHGQLMAAARGEPIPLVLAMLCLLYAPTILLQLCCSKGGDAADKGARRVKHRDSIVHHSLSQPDDYPPLDPTIDAHALRSLYKKGKLTAAAVTIQSCLRSRAVGRDELCAVTEELYDEALEAAEELDNQSPDERSKSLKASGLLLWGVPISIKDCIQQKGTDATCGIAAKCFKPFAEDGLQVTLLRNAGAILHVRSNVPQLLMMPESENNVWGVSLNPWDHSRTPGGSSGGEAALVASGCSTMGLGSDIGGSIRIPATYCGLVGFKPTPTRITGSGSVAPRYEGRNGQMVIKATVGPITRSVRDCVTMMQALTVPLAAEKDPFLPPLPPWNVTLSTKGPASDPSRPLRIGMMLTDDWFEAATVCQRAVKLAASALEDQGFEVVPYVSKYSAWTMVDLYFGILSADGNWYNHMKALEDEDLYDSYKKTRMYTDLPVCLKQPTQFVLSMLGEYRKAHAVGTMKSGGFTVREYWDKIAGKLCVYCLSWDM
jgi:fatty acid amide hydrolase